MFKSGTGRRYTALSAFIINFICAAVSIGCFMIMHHGLFSLRADFNEQIIPFSMNANSLLKAGNISWASCMDLGTDYVGAYGYYALGSPFYWLSVLFPAKYFMYAVGWIYMLKYAVAGATAFLLIERYVKDRRYALMASMLYAFSGFQTVNLLFYMFHDTVALFPLLILTLDELLENGKKGRFAAIVCLSAVLNYFFFIGEVIFLIIYFCCRYLSRDIKCTLRRIRDCLAEGFIGVGMSAVLFLPSVLFTLDNPRVKLHITLSKALHYDLIRYLTLLRAFIFPGEMMSDQSTLSKIDWTSASAYLPMFGIVLVLAYMIKNRNDWLSRLMLVCAIFSVIPFLNEMFTLLTSDYCRWYYMPILFMSVASAIVCDNADKYNIRIPAAIAAALESAFIIGAVLIDHMGLSWKVILRPRVFLVQCLTAFLGIFLTLLFFRCGKKKLAVLVLSGVMMFSAFTTIWTIYLYRQGQESPEELYGRIEAASQLHGIEPGFRLTNKQNSLTIAAGHQGSGTFSTTVNGSIFDFYKALGLTRINNSPDGPEGMRQLLSEKYTINSTENGRLTVSEDSTVVPVGFTYDTYMTRSEFDKVPPEERAVAMVNTLVVPDDSERQVSDILQKNTYDGRQKERIPSEYSESYSDKGDRIAAEINAGKKCYGFFSIPYDRGWKAYVNGTETGIIDINGLMAVRLESGKNEVIFLHSTYGLKCGMILSLISFAILCFYCNLNRKTGK